MPAALRVRKPARPPALASPDKDPRFKRVVDHLDQSASKFKQHPPAKKKAAEAQAAAVPPTKEKIVGAQAMQVDKMKEAKTVKPDPNSFLALLRAEIEKVMPQNLEEADQFMEGGEHQQMKGAVTGKVNEQKDEAAQEIKSSTEKPPDPSGVPGKEVKTLPAESAPAAPTVDAGQGMPAPKPDAEVSQQQNKQEADQQMKEAEITPQQLKKANDPRFSAVLTTKSTVEKVADATPAKYRAKEKTSLAQAVSKAQSEAKLGAATMVGVKTKSGAEVISRQLAAKQRDEKRRKEVTDTIEGIYNSTKKAVESKLRTLETDVSSMFDAGANAAIANMKDNSNREIEKFKDERYSGLIGKGRWIADLFRPVPPEIKQILQRNRAAFTAEMDKLVVRIAATVETRLQQAKGEIDKGQAKIKSYVTSLPADLKAVGQAAEKEVATRFDELRNGVDEKKNALASKLAQQYKATVDKADAAMKEIEAENEGAFAGFIKAIGEVMKALLEFKVKLKAMLKKGQDAIGLIIADPIGFLENLLNAVKKGINQFSDNIEKHFKNAVMEWIFGTLKGAGIQLPKDYTVPSILLLVLQILGITYDKMRAKAVKLIGPRAVGMIEKVGKAIYLLITSTPAQLWEMAKEYLSNLKDTIIEGVKEWAITAIVKAAVLKLASMFNPVGAIVQAIMAIYNTVMFFIERINQILAFVESIISSIFNIAKGNIADAANWIEKALANTVILIIAFLARLLGLSGLSDSIRKIITKIQTKVDKAIDKVIEKVVAGIKKLVGKGGKPDERTEEQKQQDLDKAIAESQLLVQDDKVSEDKVRKQLPAIRSKYNLTSLELVIDSEDSLKETVHVHGEINPKKDSKQGKKDKEGKAIINYGSIDGNGRRSGISATITKEMILKGTSANPSIRPPGYIGREDRHARGHLLARQLGGSGDEAANLVTVYQNPVNVPLMSTKEDLVRKAVEAGEIVEYVVTPIYKGSGKDEMPHAITMTARGNKSFSISVTILNQPYGGLRLEDITR